MADHPDACCPTEERLAEFCFGRPSEGERVKLAQHLGQCARCAQWVAVQRENDSWIRGARQAADQAGVALGETQPTPVEAPASQGTGGLETVIQALLDQDLLAPPSGEDQLARLGSYQITGCLGRGGMGVVLQAYDETLRRVVALKVLRPELAADTVHVSRFLREARAAARLRHANIVTIHAVGEHEGTHYLAMECIAGCTLAEHLRRNGPLPVDEAKAIFRQLLAGLQAAHDEGLVHRDIKPSNIMLDNAERQVKITDFGLAKLIGAHTYVTATGQVLGTPHYMSPEQVQNQHDVSAATDLYSAGAVLYEMLTGAPPFQGDRPTTVLYQIVHEPPRDPGTVAPNVDARLARCALRLLAKRPEHRFASAAEALAALDARQPAPLPEWRARWQRRITRGLTGLALIAALVTGVWWLGQARPRLTSVATTSSANPDGRGTTIWAGYDQGLNNHKFHEFESPGNYVTDVALIRPRPDGPLAVYATLYHPVKGHALFAFDHEANELGRWDLSPRPGAPFGGDLSVWGCDALQPIDADGDGLDELFVVASHVEEGPTRVVLFDPRERQVISSFWHRGDINEVSVVDGFFDNQRTAASDDTRPALLLKGCNNGLCDSWNGQGAGREQLADWNIVPTVAILDPLDMDGVGPGVPASADQPARFVPHAYAYLNLPTDRGYMQVVHEGAAWERSTKRIRPDLEANRMGAIHSVVVTDYRGPDDAGPYFKVLVVVPPGTRNPPSRQRAILTVDRHLNLVALTRVTGDLPADPADTTLPFDEWTRHWRTLTANPPCAPATSP